MYIQISFVVRIIEPKDTVNSNSVWGWDWESRDVLGKLLTFIVGYLTTIKYILSYLFQG